MKLRVLSEKYTCGGCTVCCTIMAVQELGKPFYTRCEHESESSCAIYDDRPKTCREFVCVWLAGLIADSDIWRPDKLGLMFFIRRFADGLWLEIYEAVPAAASDTKRMEYAVKRIRDRVERIERIAGTRLHHYGDKVGLGFVADLGKHPQGAAVSLKMNRYEWVNNDKSRQVFLECHDPT